MTEITSNEDVLGFIVLYGATSTRDVSYEEAQAAADRHGLVYVPLQVPTPSRAFARAMKAREAKDLRARKAVNDPEKSVTLLIRERHEAGTENFDYAQEDRAEFNKKTQSVIVSGERKPAILADYARYSLVVVGDDVRQMTRNVIEHLDGISLRGSADVRDAGGVYFVPVRHRAQLQALSNVLDELGIAYLRAYGVVRGAAEEMQVAVSAESYVEKQIGDIVRAIRDVKLRIGAVERHKKELFRLREILHTYASMSGRGTPDTLLRRIEEALVLADKKIAALALERTRRQSNGRSTKTRRRSGAA
jgi:hypothetical protein